MTSFSCLLFAGAKPAPGICFQRVNSAGDPYGNCGKDSKGSFAKCDARYVSGAALLQWNYRYSTLLCKTQ